MCAGDALAAPALPRVLPDGSLVRGAAGRHAERRSRLRGLLVGTATSNGRGARALRAGRAAARRVALAGTTHLVVAAAARAQVACPAMTELEVHMRDWLARLLRLPRHFLFNPTPTPAVASADGNTEQLKRHAWADLLRG